MSSQFIKDLILQSRHSRLLVNSSSGKSIAHSMPLEECFGEIKSDTPWWQQLKCGDPADQRRIETWMSQEGSPQDLELFDKEGRRRRILMTKDVVPIDGQICWDVGLHELESIARRHDLLRFALASTAAKTGAEFYRDGLRMLCEAFEMDIAFIARLHESGSLAEMLHFYAHGKFVKAMTYEIEDTPCWNVYRNGRVYCVANNVQNAYPNDQDLVSLGAASYVGVPIIDRDRTVIGHIALLHTEPIKTPKDHEEVVLQIFAARAESEVQHLATQQQLSAARIEAESANRCKTQFLANMSHELRTPLTSMLGLAQLMQSDPLMAAEHLVMLESINRNGDALAELINDILELSKIELGRVELNLAPVSLSDLVEDLLSTYMPLADAKNVNLSFELPCSYKSIRSDRIRLRQILGNLIGNGIQYTLEGGNVSLRVECDKNTVFFVVQDDGVGIPPENLATIFDPFERGGEDQSSSVGLGLSIAKSLADIMGGSIEVQSDPGLGATFTLVLPAEWTDAIANESNTDSETTAITPGGRILVVDDNASTRNVIRRVLEKSKYEVTDVETGAGGIEACLENPPELIIMDLRMPDMDGMQTAERIRLALGSDCPPILGLTGDLMGNGPNQVFVVFDAIMAKPFRMTELVQSVATLIQGDKLVNGG